MTKSGSDIDNVTTSTITKVEVMATSNTGTDESLPVTTAPPLVLAALRLEKILQDYNTSSSSSNGTNNVIQVEAASYYMNPIKVVRRWLGTSSGATSSSSSSSNMITINDITITNTNKEGGGTGGGGGITIEDIQYATKLLLNPNIECIQNGRQLLLSVVNEHKTSTTATDNDSTTTTMMMIDDTTTTTTTTENHYVTIASAREVECWLFSLMIRTLWKQQQQQQNFVTTTTTSTTVSKHNIHDDIMTFANHALTMSTSHLNHDLVSTTAATATTTVPSIRSSMYPLIARLYRFAALAYESYITSNNNINNSNSSNNMLSTMSQAHTHAIVRRDVDTQATILNIMLRELLRQTQVEQAQTLLSNTKFPDEMASNNQYCRYLYYSGRIYALRLEYTTAYASLTQCLRKLPHNTGVGFRICVQRLVIVVQLLMGEIPDRHIFNTPECCIELQPYLSITTAVRHGDLVVFEQVVAEHTQRLQMDGTYTLISRLAHQVVKAGLRKLNISYSRLSLQDIATRLGLPSAKSAEYVVAKAVRDGVIDATIYHNEGYVESHDLIDVYSTKEPAEAFHRRIAYCLTTHNDAVRGMRYPPDAYKEQLEASRGNRRKRNDDTKTDEEKAKEYEDEFDDDY